MKTFLRTLWKSVPMAPLRRYAYGGVQLLVDLTCAIPSQHIRRWLLKGLFGLKMAPGSVIYRGCRLREPWRITIGAGTSIGSDVELDGRGVLTIGRNVNVGTGAMVWTAGHDHNDPDFSGHFEPVVIGDYVWLTVRVIIVPGVTIAEGCVIGAAAVVTANTEPYGVYAGVPARRIEERSRNLRYSPGKGYMPFA